MINSVWDRLYLKLKLLLNIEVRTERLIDTKTDGSFFLKVNGRFLESKK